MRHPHVCLPHYHGCLRQHQGSLPHYHVKIRRHHLQSPPPPASNHPNPALFSPSVARWLLGKLDLYCSRPRSSQQQRHPSSHPGHPSLAWLSLLLRFLAGYKRTADCQGHEPGIRTTAVSTSRLHCRSCQCSHIALLSGSRRCKQLPGHLRTDTRKRTAA